MCKTGNVNAEPPKLAPIPAMTGRSSPQLTFGASLRAGDKDYTRDPLQADDRPSVQATADEGLPDERAQGEGWETSLRRILNSSNGHSI